MDPCGETPVPLIRETLFTRLKLTGHSLKILAKVEDQLDVA
jgi:hypothetical protein